jgi:hypothetical protein
MANRETLQKTLNANYDLDFFHRNVLHPVFRNSLTVTSVPEKRNINASEERLVKSIKKYGTVALTDYRELDLYDVELADNVVIERSRVSIGAVIKKYIFGNNAVLVNFHYENQPEKSWRLSFIAKEQQIEEGEIIKGETNPKRYTYVLGQNETCRTAAERFEKLSMETEFTIDKLSDAFSVEKLSKTFFDEYKEHYLDFVEHLNKRNIKSSVFNGDEKAIRDFAKKLLGRIVFLYFVQKKGWLGASNAKYADGSPNFLEELFITSGKNESFYNVWLKKLFYDTLNNQNRQDDAFKLPDGKMVRIPFLNGGLFEDDDPKGILTFPPKLFTDLFEFFKTYNFTIYEDSPDDHTLAVDPEMLGHIFENLLEDNKDKGTYYTPKEIVHYMCQESLIEYLATKLSITETVSFQQLGKDQTEMFAPPVKKKQLTLVQEHRAPATEISRTDVEQFIKHKQLTDEIKKHSKDINKYLDEVKICDPAIGSGAFPMGLLHEIFNAKLLLNEETGINSAEIKQNIIQNSIYGVDIENGAVDIARLRFWLSLIVDEDKPRALPNLDYKIVVGDSLLPKFEGEVVDIDWDLKDIVVVAKPYVEKIKSGLKEIVEKQKQFFKTKSNKSKLQNEIRDLKIDLLINQLTFDKLKYADKNLQSNQLFEKTKKDNEKELEIKMKIAGYEQIIKKLEGLKKRTTQPLQFFDWKLNFPEIMNPAITGEKCGFDIVIANPPYVSWYSKQARVLDSSMEKALRSNYKFIKGESPKLRINSVMFFMEKGFGLLKQNAFIIYIQDLNVLENPFKSIRKFVTDNYKLNELITGLKAFENVGSGQVIFSGYKSKALNSFFKIQETLEKKNSVFLGQDTIINNDYSWIISSNQSFLHFIEKNSEILETYFESHTGVAVNATEDGKAYFIRDTHVKNSYPFLKGGSSVYKSFCKPLIDAYLIHDKKMESKLNDEFDEWYFENKGSHQRPFNLRKVEEYNRPKIFLRQSDIKFTATYVEDFVFGNYSLFNIYHSENKKEELKYLLAILNSSLLSFYGRETEIILIKAGKTPQIRSGQRGPIGIKQLPIKRIENKKPFIILVDKILSTKEKNPEADTTNLESEIDLMVYKLYQLTYDEVLVVDKEFEKHMGRTEYDKLDYGFEYVQPDKTAIPKTKGRSSNFDLLKDLEF